MTYQDHPGYGPPPGLGGRDETGPPRRRTGRRILLVVVAMIVLGGLVTGAVVLFTRDEQPANAANPRAVATALFNDSRNQNSSAARKLFCRADVTSGRSESILGGGTVTSYRIESVRRSNDRATVVATVTTAGNEEIAVLPMARTGSGWHVCFTAKGAIAPSTPLSTQPSASQAATRLPSVGPISTPSLPNISLPSIPGGGLPSLPAGTNPCGLSSSPAEAATVYVGLAEIGQTDAAQGCVYRTRVPRSVTAAIATPSDGSTSLYAPSGGSAPTFNFRTVDSKHTLAVTMHKESDGKYYVVRVRQT